MKRGTELYSAKAASTEVRNYDVPTKIGHMIGQRYTSVESIFNRYSNSEKNNIGHYAYEIYRIPKPN